MTVSVFVKESGKNFAYIAPLYNFSPAAEFNLTTGAITNQIANVTTSMTDFGNGWWRISVTSTATAILYLNGVQIGSPVTSFSVMPSSNFNGVVGSEDTAFNDPFGGSIGLLQIYNRALSATEVLQNYNATKGRFGL